MSTPAATSGRGGTQEAQKERAQATRAALLDAARALFGEAGFHAAGTHDIVGRSGLTRGALYHHFADKAGLFEEVFRTVAAELVRRTNASVESMRGDLRSQVTGAFRSYLDLVATTGEYQRILLIDGPVVLGWARWREIQSEMVSQGVAEALAMLMDAGLTERQPPIPLAHAITAALNDAALSIAHSPTPSKSATEAIRAFLFLLEGIYRSPDERTG